MGCKHFIPLVGHLELPQDLPLGYESHLTYRQGFFFGEQGDAWYAHVLQSAFGIGITVYCGRTLINSLQTHRTNFRNTLYAAFIIFVV